MKDAKDHKKGHTPRAWTKTSAIACVNRCVKAGTRGLRYWSAVGFLEKSGEKNIPGREEEDNEQT